MTAALIGCSDFSEQVSDPSVGMNGSFEVVRDGLPVNWYIYTTETIPEGDYELLVDTNDFRHGRQSLKFLVHEASPGGGWHSPGLFQEYPATPGGLYRVTLWTKNEGATFRAVVGGVAPQKGQFETVVETDESIPEWRMLDHEIRIRPDLDGLRFEVNILSPGTFWIDDVRIEEIREMTGSELVDFATRYAAAWSSQNPEKLASFYAQDGRLIVNGGTPSAGRDAIAETARGFMTAFPHMVVRMDSVNQHGNRARFHWHWTGTNTGPGGTGRAVDLHGYEDWTMSPGGLILVSDGHYDEEEYQRQVSDGGGEH